MKIDLNCSMNGMNMKGFVFGFKHKGHDGITRITTVCVFEGAREGRKERREEIEYIAY